MSTVPDDSDARPEATPPAAETEAAEDATPEDSFERTLAGLYPRLEFTAEEKDFLRKSGLI